MARNRQRRPAPDLFDWVPTPCPRIGPAQLDAHCLVDAMGQIWRIASIAESGLACIRTRDGLAAADIPLRPAVAGDVLEEIRHAA